VACFALDVLKALRCKHLRAPHTQGAWGPPRISLATVPP